jgi:hypothetical protein
LTSVQTEIRDEPRPSHIVNRATKRAMVRKFQGVVRTELVAIPEWVDIETGQTIELEVRSLTGGERADYLNAMQGEAGEDGTMRRIDFRQATGLLAYLSTFDPDTGERIFDSTEDALTFDASVLQRLNDVANELSGIDKDEEEAAGNV